MNRLEFIEKIAAVSGVEKKSVSKVIASMMEVVKKTLKKGDNITLTGFGTFSVKKRAARIGRNPATGAKIKIKAKKVPVFSAGKGLKDAL